MMMNYKTLLAGVLLAGSLQQAWAMNEDSDQGIATYNIGIAEGGWLMNTSPEDDLFNATQLAQAAGDFEALDLADFRSPALIDAQKACAAAGINLRETQAPEFKTVAQEYQRCLGTHRCANPSNLAVRIHKALQTYKENETKKAKE